MSHLRWCDFPGHKLIKNVSVEIGGVTVASYRVCQKCAKTFEYDKSEDDFYKLQRLLSSRGGNLDLCADCDEPISSHKSIGNN